MKTLSQGIQDRLGQIQAAKSKFKGKAALELKEWKKKGMDAIEDLKEKVKEEVKKADLETRSHLNSNGSPTNGKSKQIVGGWVLTRRQMAHLSEQPYLYNASAGSYLELFCLQR